MAKRHESLTEEQAESLLEAVSERFGSDMGSPTEGYIHVASAGLYWANGLIAKDQLVKERVETLALCEPILNATREGKPETALAPPSAAPLQLPDVETCLAYAAIGSSMPDDLKGLMADSSSNEIRARWLAGLSAAERDEREKALLDRIVAMDPPPSAEQIASYLGWACLPAVSKLMKPSE